MLLGEGRVWIVQRPREPSAVALLATGEGGARGSAALWPSPGPGGVSGGPSPPGGQRLLAVDLPRAPPAEEQQGPLLPAAVAAAAPHAPEPGPGQGLLSPQV